MSIELAVEVAAVGLALWAVKLSLPKAPVLAWERLLKVSLSVITAGEVEREHGQANAAAQQAWAAAVLGPLAWSPLGRGADWKLSEPAVERIEVPALEGERALVEDLARLGDPSARYRRIYMEDERARDELLGDPSALGTDHDPAVLLGPGAGWDDVAAWSESLVAVLSRRLDGLVFVLDGTGPALADALTAALTGLRVLLLPPVGVDTTGETEVMACFEPIDQALTQDSDRVVLIGGGRAIQRTLASLEQGAGLRDRCAAVVSLGGQLQVPDFQEWLDEHFNNDRFDTELRRSVPFISVVNVDPTDPLAHSWDAQRFPVPPPTAAGRAAIDIIDLGPLALDAIPTRVLARGLLLFLALRLAA